MRYDFDEVIDRKNTASVKWDGVGKVFGDDAVLPMWVADMDFPSPRPVVEAVTRRAEQGIYGYTLRTESLHAAIVDWMSRRHGWSIRSEWLIFTPGIVPALGLAVSAFSQPGDKVIVQSPVYHPFFAAIRNNGRQVVDNPLRPLGDSYEMDFDNLERCFDSRTKLMLLCSPHNPVGRVWQRDELARLGEICARHNVVVVSDEIHCDLVIGDTSHTPFASVGDAFAQNSVTCIAPSKTFNLAGLATSAVIIPNERLRGLFCNTVENVHIGGSNVFGVVAWEAACRYGEEWLDHLLEYLRGNFDFLAGFVAERIPGMKVMKLEGTYLAWLDCRGLGLKPGELKRFLVSEAKVGLNDGAVFGPGGEGFQRMNLACSRSVLEEGLRRIERAVAKLESRATSS